MLPAPILIIISSLKMLGHSYLQTMVEFDMLLGWLCCIFDRYFSLDEYVLL